MKIRIMIIILVMIFFETTFPDQWFGIEPYSCTSHSAKYVAEIFPAKSRLTNRRPTCYFFKQIYIDITKEEYNVKNRFKLIWSGNLVNDVAPITALVSTNGYLVTLDDYANMGFDHSIVIYNKLGQLIEDFTLSDLVPEKDIYSKFPISTSSIHWRNNARYFFTHPTIPTQRWDNPSHFYILLEYNFVIEIKLDHGSHSYGELKNYPFLNSLVNEKYSNDEYKIWEISLENSSITELLSCNNN